MKNQFERFLSLLLAVVMVVSMVPTTALASTEKTTSSHVAEVDGTGYDTLQDAIDEANGQTVTVLTDIVLDTKLTTVDGTVIDLNGKTLYINVENSSYNNTTIKNGNIVLGKDDVHVCDGYFLVNAGKMLILDNVDMSSSSVGIKAYAVFHLKTGANLDLTDSTLNIAQNEYSAGYVVYAGESTATVDITGTTLVANANGIVHATTVIDDSSISIQAVEHGINRSGVTINDSRVTISGGTGRGITAQHGDLVITGSSEVTISNMGEATIELRGDKNLSVAETAEVTVDVAVNNTTNGTVSGDVTVDDGSVDAEETLSGTGTEEDPYLICDLDDLILFKDSVNAGETKYNAAGLWVALDADIDLAGTVWTEGIGDGHNWSFDGCFDGKGHVIKNLTVQPYADEAKYLCGGLFGYIWQGVVIRNLVIENATIDCGTTEGHNVGVLVGFANRCNGAQIENITVRGDIQVNAPNVYGVGAIVGYGMNNGFSIKNCTVDANDGAYINGYSFVGGIIGYSYQGSEIKNCTVKNVDITATSRSAAGITGLTLSDNKITGCVVVDVTVSGEANTGSVIGAIAANGVVVENCTASEPVVGGSYSDNTKVAARIGGKYYATLQDAIDAANVGDTVTVLADISLADGIVIDAEDEIILELNGNTISRDTEKASSTAAITNNGKLTVQDSVGGGKITAFAHNPDTAEIPYYANNTITNCGVLTVKSGTIENSTSDAARAAFPIDNNSTSRDAIVIIQGGTVIGRGAIRQFANSTTHKNEVNITGGIVSGTSYGLWMQNPGSGDPKATLTISGGTVAKVLLSPSANFGPAINGGTVSEIAVWEADTTNTQRNPSGFITGGSFGTDVSAFCADGYEAVYNEATGNYGVAEEALSGTGTEEDPYQIGSKEEMFLFAQLVNDGTYSNVHVVLTADIDLEQDDWTSIGTSANPFTGTFDGRGHTISNLWCAGDQNGLFGYIATDNRADNYGNEAVITNLTVTNAVVTDGGQKHNGAGVVVGCANMYATITNVTVNGQILVTGKRAGGILGYTYGGAVIDNCHVDGGDKGTSKLQALYWAVGGIGGFLSTDDSSSTVTNCSVKNLTVEAVKYYGAASIVGNMGYDDTVFDVTAENVDVIGARNESYNAALIDVQTIGGDSWAKNVTVTVGGREVSPVDMVAKVGDVLYPTLQAALDAAVAGTGNVTVEILRDIDLSNVDWKPVTVSGPGYPLVTVNGNNKTITGLNDMLFAGTWAGKSGLIINDLTIKDSNIANDVNDTKGTVGVGAFIGYPQASATITLNNCHLVDSTVSGGHWTGGLIGMAGGYNGSDGPVFMNLTVTGCSVTGSTITGKGSAGGVIGHGSCAAWTNVVIADTTVSGNTITSTGSSTNKAGSVMGTIGAAGQPTTAGGETKTGGAFVTAITEDNTVTSGGIAITTIYGRQGSTTGALTLTGGTYANYPIEENVSYAAIAEGYVIKQNADNAYCVVADPSYGKVAKIGDTYYATLAEALEAAKNGDTVMLLDDVTLTETLTVEKAVTLDLNDKTLTGADNAVVLNIKAATTVQGGKILGNKSGTSSGLIDIYADLTMDDVTVETSKIYALRFKVGSCKAVLNDCNIIGAFKGYGSSVWEIRSGTYKASSTTISDQLNGTASVYGGTFHYAIDEVDCAPGYAVVDNGDGTWTVKYAPACFVDTDNDGVQDQDEPIYANLDQVFAKHQQGDVHVVLTADITANGQVDTDVDAHYYITTNVAEGVTADFLFADDWNYVQKMSVGQNVTLNVPYLLAWTDLDIYGTVNTGYAYFTTADVTVHEGAALNISAGEATVQVKNGAKLTVNGTLNTHILNVWEGESVLTVSGENAKVNAAWIDIWSGAPSLKLENGALLVVDSIKVSRGGTITVDAAVLDTENLEVGHNGESAGTVTVTNNGTITKSVLTSIGSTIAGPEGMDVTTNIADHKVVYNNGVYAVAAKDYVAQVGQQKFESLTDAMAEAEDGDTIKLLVDCVSTDLFATVPAGVTLDLNGNTWEVGHNLWAFGQIVDGTVGGAGSLVVAGNAILDENNPFLPLYDTAIGGYRFYAYGLRGRGVRTSGSGETLTFRYGFAVDFANPDAYLLMKDAANSGLELIVDLKWTDMPAGKAVIYTVSDETVADFAENAYQHVVVEGMDKTTYVVSITVTGLSGFSAGTAVTAELRVHTGLKVISNGVPLIETIGG